MSRRTIGWIAAGVAGLLAAGAATAGSAAAGQRPAAAPKWRVVETVKMKNNTTADFTAVVATGKTSGWAFDGFAAPGGETAWERTGNTTWKKVAFPGKSTEYVDTADATSPKDVWAFADDFTGTASRVLRWTGSKWTAVKSFGGSILGASVLGSSDVWVFGQWSQFGPPGIGVWHYNGHSWKQIGKNIAGGTALNDHDVWGFTGTSVEHWNGHKWTATSVKGLLPKKQQLNDPSLVGVLAVSDSRVYAIGTGQTQDEGGPVVVLYYNGHKWSKVAQGNFGFGPDDEQISYDGSGGLWLPMDGPEGGTSYLVHYSAGKLTKAAVPINPATLTITSVARIPGTTEQLAGGYTHPNDNRTATGAVILQSS
jgi:hypothetical protein